MVMFDSYVTVYQRLMGKSSDLKCGIGQAAMFDH